MYIFFNYFSYRICNASKFRIGQKKNPIFKREEAKVTRTLIATNSNTNLIEKIIQEENIVGLPALDLESFLDFEKQLKTDIELIKKIVRFISEIVQFNMSFNFY